MAVDSREAALADTAGTSEASELVGPSQQDLYYEADRGRLVGKDLGFGPLTEDDARWHTAWHAASGHRSGWRVVRGLAPMQQLEDRRGRVILFGSSGAAGARADLLNKQVRERFERAGIVYRPVQGTLDGRAGCST